MIASSVMAKSTYPGFAHNQRCHAEQVSHIRNVRTLSILYVEVADVLNGTEKSVTEIQRTETLICHYALRITRVQSYFASAMPAPL